MRPERFAPAALAVARNFIRGYGGSDSWRGTAGMGVAIFNANFVPPRDRPARDA